MSNKKPFYITTPIYYASGSLHIGHCYTTVVCDAIARFQKMRGYDVFYLTGTDEHGQKVEKSAAERGLTPKAFVDGLVDDVKKLWSLLDIDYNGFIRTTDEHHQKAVQTIFQRLYDKGDIYKSQYEGLYCTPCEAFWTKSQLVEGKCPDCGREVKPSKEECYFFRLSKYQDRIERLLTDTDFLLPKSRAKEMVNNFVKPGLTDLAVSRTSFSWGIPISFDDKHIIYVWIDALSNYITALGAFGDDDSLFKKYWPCDVHMVGKEIVRFHAIIWPAILMALDLPLPKKIFGHGWILFGGDKMSKSKGNIVDPFILADRYGVDALRYYLLREIPFGSDGIFTEESYLKRINSDLVNDLGNLFSRTTAMAKQYFEGKVSKGAEFLQDNAFVEQINALKDEVEQKMDSLEINKAVEQIFALVSSANKYIDQTMPWVLSKSQENKSRLNTVLYNLLEALRVCAVLLTPFLTKAPLEILQKLGATKQQTAYDALYLGGKKDYSIEAGGAIYKRLDIQKELKELDNLKQQNQGQDSQESLPQESQITIDEFFNTKLIVAKVLDCQKVEKADKLLKLTVDDGQKKRTVVSGIAQSYSCEELIGRSVVLVANLKPVKLRGIESEGMILCATDSEGKPIIVSPEKQVQAGTTVK